MSSLKQDITIELKHRECDEEECDYKGALTSVSASILLKGIKIGKISAILMDRNAIPEQCIYQVADEHSSELQWVVCALLENRFGRTKLETLVGDDDSDAAFLYIQRFHVDDSYKQNGDSDVGSIALYKFLRDPFIGQVSTAAYAIDAEEAMSPSERKQHEQKKYCVGFDVDKNRDIQEQRRLDSIARADANQFLRNGFVQDPALAKTSGTNARILVASSYMWDQPLTTHDQAAATQFYEPPPVPAKQDSQIRDLVEKAMEHELSTAELSRLVTDINGLVAAGGSLERSRAFHVACANNSIKVVTMLLAKEPALINARDELELTPLMIAAANAAGRVTSNGLGETEVIQMLLSSGADKNLQDARGMTAYGHFKQSLASYADMIMAMTGRIVPTACGGSGQTSLEARLTPVGGPTPSDVSGGKGAGTGFVDYTEEDRLHDQDMGMDCSDGDY